MENQLLLFEEPKSELTALWVAVEKLKTSHNKVRKRLFAEVGELQDQLHQVKAENARMRFHAELKPTLRWTA